MYILGCEWTICGVAMPIIRHLAQLDGVERLRTAVGRAQCIQVCVGRPDCRSVVDVAGQCLHNTICGLSNRRAVVDYALREIVDARPSLPPVGHFGLDACG